MEGPSLPTGPPNACIPERPFHQTGSHVLEDRELVPARILEEQARSRRDLERAPLRLPTAGSKALRGRLEVLDLENRQHGRRVAVVREEVLRPVGETHGRDLRAELMIVPEELASEDLRVVFEVPIEVAGADVKVGELAEGSGHHLGDKSTGAMSLAGTGQNLLHTASSYSAARKESKPPSGRRTANGCSSCRTWARTMRTSARFAASTSGSTTGASSTISESTSSS